MLSPVSWATWPILAAWLTSFLAPIPTVQSGVNSRVKGQMKSGTKGEPSKVEGRISCDHVSAAQAAIDARQREHELGAIVGEPGRVLQHDRSIGCRTRARDDL